MIEWVGVTPDLEPTAPQTAHDGYLIPLAVRLANNRGDLVPPSEPSASLRDPTSLLPK